MILNKVDLSSNIGIKRCIQRFWMILNQFDQGRTSCDASEHNRNNDLCLTGASALPTIYQLSPLKQVQLRDAICKRINSRITPSVL